MTEQFKPILAGFGKMDVTPFAKVHLGSMNNDMQRISRRINPNDPFNAMTLALTDDNGDTFLFIVTDLSWGHINWARKIRPMIEEKYGIPGDHIVLGGTHNHSGPSWYGEALQTSANQAYFDYWLVGVMSSVYIALQDRKPAQMQIGRTETENYTFVRRYWREDGNLAGDAYGYVPSKSPVVAHESEGDEEIQMVRFVREGGKDIVIGQWQSHANKTGNTTVACTDWVGPLREKVEKELGCHFMYMQGAAGNLNPKSRLKAEYPVERTPDEVGEGVASYIIEAYRKEGVFQPVKTGTIKTKQENFSGKLTTQDMAWTAEFNTMSIGDLAVITFPVEIFAETGIELKTKSPYEMTLLMGYSCGYSGYVPTREAYLNGGYESLHRGQEDTADRLVATYLTSLKELHG